MRCVRTSYRRINLVMGMRISGLHWDRLLVPFLVLPSKGLTTEIAGFLLLILMMTRLSSADLMRRTDSARHSQDFTFFDYWFDQFFISRVHGIPPFPSTFIAFPRLSIISPTERRTQTFTPMTTQLDSPHSTLLQPTKLTIPKELCPRLAPMHPGMERPVRSRIDS